MEGLRRTTETSFKIAGVPAEVRSKHLQNTRLEQYLYTIPFGETRTNCSVAYSLLVIRTQARHPRIFTILPSVSRVRYEIWGVCWQNTHNLYLIASRLRLYTNRPKSLKHCHCSLILRHTHIMHLGSWNTLRSLYCLLCDGWNHKKGKISFEKDSWRANSNSHTKVGSYLEECKDIGSVTDERSLETFSERKFKVILRNPKFSKVLSLFSWWRSDCVRLIIIFFTASWPYIFKPFKPQWSLYISHTLILKVMLFVHYICGFLLFSKQTTIISWAAVIFCSFDW